MPYAHWIGAASAYIGWTFSTTNSLTISHFINRKVKCLHNFDSVFHRLFYPRTFCLDNCYYERSTNSMNTPLNMNTFTQHTLALVQCSLTLCLSTENNMRWICIEFLVNACSLLYYIWNSLSVSRTSLLVLRAQHIVYITFRTEVKYSLLLRQCN